MNLEYLVEKLQATRREAYDHASEALRMKAAMWFYLGLSVVGWSLFIAAMVVKS